MKSWLMLATALLAGCGGGDGGEGPDVGDDSLNGTAKLIRGPYLQAPSATTIVVSWATDIAAGSAVELDGPGGTRSAKGRTFPGDDIDGQHSLDGFQHEVVLTGLMPNMAYGYRVTSLPAATERATFSTPPPAGESFDFLIYGDTRTEGARHREVAAAMAARAPDFVVFTGDAVTIGNDSQEWADWFTVEAPILKQAVFYPVFGNHESLLGKAAFDAMFRVPAGAFSERTYGFDHGALHVAVIDAYDPKRAEVLTWLDADLAAATTRGARFLAVAMHPPAYTFSFHSPDQSLRADLAPILARRGVKLVMTGHNHLYERFQVDGVVHLTVGGGGAPGYEATVQMSDPATLRCKVVTGLSYVVGSVAGDTLTLRTYDPTKTTVDNVAIGPTTIPPYP